MLGLMYGNTLLEKAAFTAQLRKLLEIQRLQRHEHPMIREIGMKLVAKNELPGLIPKPIEPARKLSLSAEKRAYLSGALRGFGSYAARNPDDALALTHLMDESLKGGLKGALIGGAGGYLAGEEGREEDTALRGALLGAGFGAIHRGATKGMEMRDLLRTPEGARAAARRLRQLSEGGRSLSESLDY
jgi:hypothetical protein